MKITVHTVPGTGTRFLCNILETVFGYEGISLREFAQTNEPNVFALKHVHFGFPSSKVFRNIPDIPLITSLRHPHLAFLARINFELFENVVNRWRHLIEADKNHNMTYFPVDGDLDRTHLLRLLGEYLGMPVVDGQALDSLLVDWAPVGSGQRTIWHREYDETGDLNEYDLDQLQFAVDWYEQKLDDLSQTWT